MRRITDRDIQIHSIVKSLTFRKIIALFLIICFSMQFIDTVPIDAYNNEEDNDIDLNQNEDIARGLSSMKGWFTENKGQIGNSDVEYVYGASDLSIGFIESGYLIKLTNGENRTSVVKVTFEGANTVVPEGRGELPHRSNYFRGNDSSKWIRGVRNYDTVVYENLYDGIDLIFYTAEKGLKYDFMVSPGANPDEICIGYEGIDDLDISSQGNLHISISSQVLIEEAPYCYQKENGDMKKVDSSYQVSENKVNFSLGSYDPFISLIIDPLIYSTFVGGNSEDKGSDIMLDSDNNAYIAGSTESADFPTSPDSYDTEYNGEGDVVVFKLDANGSSLAYSTYIGGSNHEDGIGMALDDEGNVYITGWTLSFDFPTTSEAYDKYFNGIQDIFVFKLNPDGSDLLYSTYIGGSNAEDGFDITIDNEGNAYITGWTLSFDFPTTIGAFDNTYNGNFDTFVVKLNEDGSSIIFSTFFGGYETDRGLAIEVDDDKNVFVAGASSSPNCPTTNGAYDNTHNGENDAVIFKMNSEGSSLIYSTFVGTSERDSAIDITIDKMGCAYVIGSTSSDIFPTTSGCYDNTYNGEGDSFALKLNDDGSSLIFSTFIGGSNWDPAGRLVINPSGDIIITGFTQSPDFPITTHAYDTSYNGGWMDVFLLQLNSDGSYLEYSTFIGGMNDDKGIGVDISTEMDVYITGSTNSDNFPIAGEAYDSSYNGDGDIFVLQMDIIINDAPPNTDPGKSDDYNLKDYHYSVIIVALIIVFSIIISFTHKNRLSKEESIKPQDENEEEK